MPEVVKVRRPKSIWLAQVMLVLTSVLMIATVVKRFSIGGFGSLLNSGYLFSILVLVASVLGIVALIKRNIAGKWTSLFALLGMALIMMYVIAESLSRRGDFWDDPVVSLFVLLFGITIFIVPYLVSSALLLFNPKVKMFFDPSLIPPIDESSAILNEPPPPPRFDE